MPDAASRLAHKEDIRFTVPMNQMNAAADSPNHAPSRLACSLLSGRFPERTYEAFAGDPKTGARSIAFRPLWGELFQQLCHGEIRPYQRAGSQ